MNGSKLKNSHSKSSPPPIQCCAPVQEPKPSLTGASVGLGQTTARRRNRGVLADVGQPSANQEANDAQQKPDNNPTF